MKKTLTDNKNISVTQEIKGYYNFFHLVDLGEDTYIYLSYEEAKFVHSALTELLNSKTSNPPSDQL